MGQFIVFEKNDIGGFFIQLPVTTIIRIKTELSLPGLIRSEEF